MTPAPRRAIPTLAPSDKFIATSGIAVPFFAVAGADGLEINCHTRCKDFQTFYLLVSHRKRKVKRRAPVGIVFRPKTPAVDFDDGPADGQSHAKSVALGG